MTPRRLPSLASSEHRGALCWKAWDWRESKGCSTHTHTHRQHTEDGLRTSLWLLHNLQLWSPFKCFTSCLCATCADTSCILTRGSFCRERDITCPEHLPLNQPSSVSQAQSCLETFQIYAHVQADTSCEQGRILGSPLKPKLCCSSTVSPS